MTNLESPIILIMKPHTKLEFGILTAFEIQIGR